MHAKLVGEFGGLPGLPPTEEDAADTIRRLATGELTESDLAAWISANQA